MTLNKTPLEGLNNNVVKVKKPKPPRNTNTFLVPLYFAACFVGAKNSGKTYGLVKLLKNFEDYPIYNNEGDKLERNTVLWCPTANSNANPMYTTLKKLLENHIHTKYTDDERIEVFKQIGEEKNRKRRKFRLK
jgi:hypothetical protein